MSLGTNGVLVAGTSTISLGTASATPDSKLATPCYVLGMGGSQSTEMAIPSTVAQNGSIIPYTGLGRRLKILNSWILVGGWMGYRLL